MSLCVSLCLYLSLCVSICLSISICLTLSLCVSLAGLLTLLVYLSDVDAGGETHFPLADNPSKTEANFSSTDDFCDLSQGLAVTPRKGDAILWSV